ncbi:MAG: T9SS type A sorting domain-containing protein [Flavobacteriales bacterium]
MRENILLLIVIWSALPLAGQTFNNRYNFDPYNAGNGYCVEQSGDSLLIFSNYSDSLYKIGVHVLSLDGELLSSKSIYKDSTWLFVGYSNSVDQYEEGYVSGSTKRFPEPNYRGHIIKWDLSADTLKTKVFHAAEGDSMIIFQQAKAIADGFVAVGSTRDGVSGEKIILLKTDFDLNEIWRREYGSSTIPHAGYSVVQTPDGGYLLGGVRKVIDSWDHCVIKTAADGVQQDIAYFGTGYEGYITHVAVTADGNYVFGGMKKTGQYEDQSLVCKIDANLNEIWCNTYNSPGPECYVNAIKLLDDGNLIVCGVDRSNWDMYGYILKIDPDGNEIWYRKYAQTEDNWCFFYDVIQTNDGGYFLTGSLFPEIDLSQDIWGLKLDDMGCLVPGCDTLVHVPERDASWGVSIYPNPTSQFVNVYLSASSKQQLSTVSLELVDMQGRLVRQFAPHLTDTTYMMDVEDLPAGIYVLNVFADGAVVKSEKIMKE